MPSSRVEAYVLRNDIIVLSFLRHKKILGVTKVVWSNFHTEDLQILGATVHNSGALVTMHLAFVRSF